jgi:hypothetical protein
MRAFASAVLGREPTYSFRAHLGDSTPVPVHAVSESPASALLATKTAPSASMSSALAIHQCPLVKSLYPSKALPYSDFLGAHYLGPSGSKPQAALRAAASDRPHLRARPAAAPGVSP